MLYNLLNTLKDNQVAFLKVKSYIDNNEEKALNSIFFENDYLAKIKDLTLKEIIRLIILDVMKNENVKFSDITFDSGGFSNVLLVGTLTKTQEPILVLIKNTYNSEGLTLETKDKDEAGVKMKLVGNYNMGSNEPPVDIFVPKDGELQKVSINEVA